MKGQELVNYIQDNNLEDSEIFVAAQGYLAETNIDNIMQTNSGDLILGFVEMYNGKFSDRMTMKTYFSRWFNIISLRDAEMLWEDGDRSFLVLRRDCSDAYADNYDSFEEIVEQVYDGALIGLERD